MESGDLHFRPHGTFSGKAMLKPVSLNTKAWPPASLTEVKSGSGLHVAMVPEPPRDWLAIFCGEED